jgi:hypothetical protein
VSSEEDLQMKRLSVLFIILGLMIIFSNFGLASDTSGSEKANPEVNPSMQLKTLHEGAYYKLPDLSEKVIKELAKALSNDKGVISANVEKKEQLFLVVFDQAVTNVDKISPVVKKIVPTAEVARVDKLTVDQEKTLCGKCPAKKTCPFAQKNEQKPSEKEDANKTKTE